MKACRRAALFLLTVFVLAGSASTVTNGTFHDLELKVDLATTEQFQITLQNKARNNLRVKVDRTLFPGRIILVSGDKQENALFEKRYLDLLTTSEWDEPVHVLPADSSITWNVPFSRISTLSNHSFSGAELAGAKVYASLDRVAVVPRDGTYTFPNTKLQSKRTELRVERAARASPR